MLRIRMRKPGKPVKGRYHFKIVVIEMAKARDSRFLEELGYYDPTCRIAKINTERYEYWFSKGASLPKA